MVVLSGHGPRTVTNSPLPSDGVRASLAPVLNRLYAYDLTSSLARRVGHRNEERTTAFGLERHRQLVLVLATVLTRRDGIQNVPDV